MQKHTLSTMNVFTILLVPTLWLYENAVVGPDIANIAVAFPTSSEFLARWAFSFTSIGVIVASFITSFLVKRFDKRNILITGLVIYSIFGLGTMLSQNMFHILIFRALTGIGGGMILPISTAIISESFEAQKRERLLGFCQSTANASIFVVSLLGGFLLPFGWKATFWLFLYVPVVLAFVLIWMTKSPPIVKEIAEEQHVSVSAIHEKMPLMVWGYMLLMALMYAIMMFDISNIALFVVKEHVAPLWSIGILVGLPAFGRTISNFFFPEINHLLKKFFPSVIMLLYAIGFFMLSGAYSVWPILVANFLFTGIAADLMSPWIFNETAKITPLSQKASAQAIVTMGIHVGCFASAPAQLLIGTIFRTDSVRVLFTSAGIVLVIAVGIALIWGIVKTRHIKIYGETTSF